MEKEVKVATEFKLAIRKPVVWNFINREVKNDAKVVAVSSNRNNLRRDTEVKIAA
jgi:hypothetical protein